MTNIEASATTEAAAVGEPGAPVAPEKATATRKASTQKGAPTGRKAAKSAKPATRKNAMVLGLLHRKGGATLAEITQATDWQNHSIRGFISGTASKRLGLKIESTRDEQGQRRYRAAK